MPEHPELREALQTEEVSRFRAFQIGRIVVLTAAASALVWIESMGRSAPEVRGALALVVVDLVLSIPYQLLARRFPGHVSTLSLAILFVEGSFLTAAAYWLGDSAFFVLPLYVGLVARAVTLPSARGAYAIAAFVTVAYGSMAALTAVGWIPMHRGPFDFELSALWPWLTMILNGVICFSLAVAGSSPLRTGRRALARSRTLESELRDLNRSLEERIADGVREARRADLRLGLENEQLERTLKQVNLFASALSHDLRNPITGAGEVLSAAEAAGPERCAMLLSLARENLMRADEMLIGLRDLMRTLGASRESPTTAVRPVVERVVRELRASRGDLPVSIQLAEERVVVEASSEQLAHVFRNLILNSLEHNEDKADLAIEIGQHERGDEISFFVRDNGAGIPHELHSRVFEPFYRGPGCRDESLGLGLALVRAIVSRAGGKVWMKSTPGAGATVRFSIPRHRDENA